MFYIDVKDEKGNKKAVELYSEDIYNICPDCGTKVYFTDKALKTF